MLALWKVVALTPVGLSAAATVSPNDADIVIIGAGPAGLTLANRLSLNPAIKIQLLEAGPDPTGVKEVWTPSDAFDLAPSEFSWNFTTTAQKGLGGLSVAQWQGHALGGGTTINDMQYGRGAPSVFDQWAEISGDDRWSWANMLPYFKKSTRLVLSNSSYAPVTNVSVYGDGPLIVSYNKDIDAFSPYFVNTFKELGVREIDLNAGEGIGVTYTTQSIRQSNATRDNALAAFGYALANRPNVQIQHGAWVKKINFRGTKAVSVTYQTMTDGHSHTIRAGEVIICSGAINTPKLLMLSGVGPRTHLESHGITVVADIPHIGENLYDHHSPTTELNVSGSVVTYSEWSTNETLYAQLLALYSKHARGPLATGLNSGAAFIRVPDEVLKKANATYQLTLPKDRPHIMYQYIVAPYLPNSYPNSNIVSIDIVLVAPEASGRVRLASSDFRDQPLIDPNYWGSEGDKASILWAYKYARDIFKPNGTDSIVINELFPGEQVTSDEEIWNAIVQTSGSYDHPVGTVVMGKVLDKGLRIKGLQGVRVVDSSIMPVIPSCWLESTMYAIGERAADIILQDYQI